MMPPKSCYPGYLLVISVVVYGSAALKIYPPLQHYNDTTDFASLICSYDNDGYVSGDDVEWLYPDFTIMMTTPDYRIYVFGDFVTFAPPLISDAGSYWCRNKTNRSDIAEGKLIYKVCPTFVYSDSPVLNENRFTLLGSNEFINCSVNYGTEYNITSWLFDYEPLLINQTSKFTQNTSGLIIYNVTKLDEGNYTCYIDQLWAVIFVHVEWPPTLTSIPDQIVRVNLSEEVVLNCTVSSSPDPVYSWSIPSNCSFYPHSYNYSVLTFTADTSDSGEYICTADNKRGSISVVFNVFVNVNPTFKFSNQSFVFKEKNVLLESDIFLNCSVDYGTQPDNITVWTLDGEMVWINETSKYNVNASGLTVYNVTAEDQGNYTCHVHHLIAVTFLHVVWLPEFSSEYNQTMMVNVSEEVILNCTVSASPDPVYSWSFPDSCSSCPHFHNKSIMFFNANINDSGEYICMAKNEYGKASREFSLHVNSKPIMVINVTTIRKDQSTGNVMLTCAVQYSYPTANITWSIMTESGVYHVVEDNFTGNYILCSNGSFEVYRRYIYEEDQVTIMCSATNKYGSAQSVFNIWDNEYFSQVKTLSLFIKAPSCEDLLQKREELYQALRVWFDSVCDCDGFNNLYKPQVTCVDNKVGKITSTVHSDDKNDKTAQMLIDLANSDIEGRIPSRVKISSDWTLCLSKECGEDDNLNNTGESGMLPSAVMQEFTIYIKNIRCRNDNKNTLISTIRGWFKSVCNCSFDQCNVTCLDNTTANITIVFQSHDETNAQIMTDKIVNYIQAQNHSVVHLPSGWAICLNVDCEWKLDNPNITVGNNSTTTINESGDNLIPILVGVVVGILLLCVVIVLLLCIIAIVRRISKKSRELEISKDSNTKQDDHIYDELDLTMYEKLNTAAITTSNKTPSPKSDKLIFDTKGIEPPAYQPLPDPRYQSCSATSIAKFSINDNDYCIKEDARSIKDEDCEFASDKMTEKHQEEISKEHEQYSKLHHFK